jgi:GNAT superfamily N-acetyltransferase
LTDPQRAVLTAQQDGRIVGYAMLIRGVADDTDVQRAVELRPAAELSKLYLLPDFHGTGVSTALMEQTLATAAEWGVRCVWLGVNQKTNAHNAFTPRAALKSAAPGRFRWALAAKTTSSWSARCVNPGGQRQKP